MLQFFKKTKTLFFTLPAHPDRTALKPVEPIGRIVAKNRAGTGAKIGIIKSEERLPVRSGLHQQGIVGMGNFIVVYQQLGAFSVCIINFATSFGHLLLPAYQATELFVKQLCHFRFRKSSFICQEINLIQGVFEHMERPKLTAWKVAVVPQDRFGSLQDFGFVWEVGK